MTQVRHKAAVSDSPDCWPSLPFSAWEQTCHTLHMWMQIVGKVKLELTPTLNHWWNVPFYVNATGLTTAAMPYGSRVFEAQFDFLKHELRLETSLGERKAIPLASRSVADFYQEVLSSLRSLGIEVSIWKMPVEVPDPVPFDQDTVHGSYDPEFASRFWRVLISVNDVFNVFRAGFIGKSSPVHFFWGSMDLAVTRFSGRRAPERNDPDPVLRKIMREAYSHEVISAGWWPGGGEIKDAAFYCYAAPEPQGFSSQRIGPASALYPPKLGEFVLMYDEVRQSSSPSQAILEFLQSTYAAAATLAGWDRDALERKLESATAGGV